MSRKSPIAQWRRFRLLPVAVAVAILMLSGRLAGFWLGVEMDPASTAFAKEDSKKTEAAAKTDKPAATSKPDAAGAADPAAADAATQEGPIDALNEPRKVFDLTTEFTPEEIVVLQDLSKRREEIDRREKEVDGRHRLLEAAEAKLETRINELKQLRGSIESLIRKYDDQEQAELLSVVKIYETMKPKEAARILGELDLEILLGILERMKERKTATILAAMAPERAREVTAEMARRRAVDLTRFTPAAGTKG